MTTSYYSPEFHKVAQAVFDSLSGDQQERVKRIGKMQAAYIRTPRDAELDVAFNGLIENAAAALFGKVGKRRALFIVGESGSGKTTAIERQVTKRPELAKRTAESHEFLPFVAFEAPKPLTLKALARKGIRAQKYEEQLPAKMTEPELFELWKTQLKEKGTWLLWIDEFQHVLTSGSESEIQNVSDVIKSLVQIEGWPLHLVLSGVPALAQFVRQSSDGDRQLRERSFVVELLPLSYPDDASKLRKIMLNIVNKDAGMKADGIDSDEFLHRIMHAANGAFGSVVQLIRYCCETAMRSGKDTVTAEVFASAYAYISGCRTEQNVFTSEDWKTIVPDNSLAEMLSRVAKKDGDNLIRKAAIGRPKKKGGKNAN